MSFWKTMKAGMDELFPRIPMRTVQEKVTFGRRRISSEWVALGLFALVGLIYIVSVATVMSRAYVDLGDGNYLYTSARVADGLMLYRDFLSPQPPMHLVVGSWLVRLGRLFGSDGALYATRIFTMMAHFLTACWLYLLGRRLTQTPYGGLVAGLIFLLLPIGYWWTLGYQSETQELFWLVGSLWFFLNFRPMSMVVSGVMMALAVLTNMTAAPYALASVFYLFIRHGINRERTGPEGWRLVAWYVGPLAGLLAVVIGYYELRTGAYFENVIFNQIGSYPKNDLWGYVMYKFHSQVPKIMAREGGYILLAILGLLLYNRTDTRQEREYLVWYALALLLAFVFVSKGGTADYIFVIAEPAVALFAAVYLVSFFYPSTFRRFKGKHLWHDTTLIAHIAVMALGAMAIGFYPLRFIVTEVRPGLVFEQRQEELEAVELFIRRYSKPGERIVAQPYYAFIADRLLAEEVSEWYLWTRRYANEIESMFIDKSEGHDFVGVVVKIGRFSDPVSQYLYGMIPNALQVELMQLSRNPEAGMSGALRDALIVAMNRAIQSPGFAAPERLAGLELPGLLRDLLGENVVGADLARRNRLLMETAYAGSIKQSPVARGMDPKGIATMKAIARSLEAREIPIVVANVSPANPLILGPQEIRRAVMEHYEPVFEGATFERMRTLSFQMQVFVPKGTLRRPSIPAPATPVLEVPGGSEPSIRMP